MRLRLAVAILAAAALWAERAGAETAPTADDDEARRLFESGQRHFQQHEYDQALTDLEASYQRVPVPALLYDLAQVHRLKGDCAEALRLYRDYLASGPSESVRERTQARVAEMSSCVVGEQEAARAQQVPAAPPRPAPNVAAAAPTGKATAATVVSRAPPPLPRASWPERLVHSPSLTSRSAPLTRPEHSSWRLVGWTVGAAGAATGLAGLVVTLLGQSHMDAARDQANRANAAADAALYADASAKFSDGISERATGRILLVIGGAVIAGGLAVVLFAPRSGTGTTIGHLEPWMGGNDRHPVLNGLLFSARW
jgi:tetratricopeptide (TPR) repeat protein